MRHLLPLLLCLTVPSLHALESVDPNFNPKFLSTAGIYAMGHQSDDTIYLLSSAGEIDGQVVDTPLVRLNAQGEWDQSYQPVIDGNVDFIKVQADDKIIISGYFTEVDGHATLGVARLLSDGSVDTDFQVTVDLTDIEDGTAWLSDIAVDSSGNIYVGLHSTVFVSTETGDEWPQLLYRLTPTGAVDASFAPVIQNTSESYSRSTSVSHVYSVSDGGVIITGDFDAINETSRSYLARLNSDGSLDEDFDPQLDGSVSSLVETAGGEYYIGGFFKEIDGIAQREIARLTATGELDTDFVSPIYDGLQTGLNVGYHMLLDSTGRLIVVGSLYLSVASHKYCIRLDDSGEVDPDFDPRIFMSSGGVSLNNGDLLFSLAGRAISSGVLLANLRYVNADDGTATDYGPEMLTPHVPEYVISRPDGSVIVGTKWMKKVNGVAVSGMSLLNADGTLDTTFSPDEKRSVSTTLLLPDGRILVGGSFSTIGGLSRKYLALLDVDGQPVADFDLGAGPSGSVSDMFLMPTGKVLIHGSFTKIDGVAFNRLALLDPSKVDDPDDGAWLGGLIDTGFQPQYSNYLWLDSAAGQANGKILIGCTSMTEGDVTIESLVRLNTDGTLDTTFNPAEQFESLSVDLIKIDPQSGDIYVKGRGLTSLNGEYTSWDLIRLEEDGTIDLSFDGSSVLGYESDFYIDAMGRIVYSGGYDGTDLSLPSNNVIRLLPDGSLDTSFDVGDLNILGGSLALQAPGRLYIWGYCSIGEEEMVYRLLRYTLGDPISPLAWVVPAAATVKEGHQIRLLTADVGLEETYAWSYGGESIAGADSASLVLTNFQPEDAGEYTLTVTNEAGTTTSTAVLNFSEYDLGEWMAAYGLGAASGDDDSDGDGQTNAAEYLARTDPTSLSSLFQTRMNVAPDGSRTLSWDTVIEREYTVQTSVDLSQWDPVDGASLTSVGEFEMPTDLDVPTRFWRVQVEKSQAE
ncbi:MAG: hypothetical protein ACQKBW_09390 [Puniceicoccales bacterium]